MKTVINVFSVVLVGALIGSLMIAIGVPPPDILKGFIDDSADAWKAAVVIFIVMMITLIGLVYHIPFETHHEQQSTTRTKASNKAHRQPARSQRLTAGEGANANDNNSRIRTRN